MRLLVQLEYPALPQRALLRYRPRFAQCVADKHVSERKNVGRTVAPGDVRDFLCREFAVVRQETERLSAMPPKVGFNLLHADSITQIHRRFGWHCLLHDRKGFSGFEQFSIEQRFDEAMHVICSGNRATCRPTL